MNAILGALKAVDVEAGAESLAAKFAVVKGQEDFLSSEEVKKNNLIEEIANLMTIDSLKLYANDTVEFADLNAAKKTFNGSEFVKKVDKWVEKLKGNQGNGKIFAATKLDSIENLTERVNAITGEVGELAAKIDTAFDNLIKAVTALFNNAENFSEGYEVAGVYDKVAAKKQGIFADNYVNAFQLAGKDLFKEKKKEEKTFRVNNTELKKLINDSKDGLAGNLENVEIESSTLKKDTAGTTSGKICGNADNLKVLLLAMVGDALYAKLTNAFNGFDDLKEVEITKENLENKTNEGISYKFFSKLNGFDDESDEDIKAFKKWIKDKVGLDTTPSSEKVEKSIWELIVEASA